MAMKNGKHFWRALALVLLVPILYLLGRPYLVPNSFGKAGFYRYDSLAEFMSQPVIHKGDDACIKCHATEGKEHAENAHKSVRCDSCHQPLETSGHILAGKKVKAMPMHKDFSLCLTCHQQLKARPKDFPQITMKQHFDDVGYEYKGEIPRSSCFECHDPHRIFK